MRSARYVFFFLLLIALFFANTATAASKSTAAAGDKSAECLACHGDPSLAEDVNGKSISLHVDEAKFKASIHGSMFTCTDCHTDVKTIPHETTPAKVQCTTCHSDEAAAYKQSVHGQAAAAGNKEVATCVSCHGGPHGIVPVSDPSSPVAHQNIPKTCGSCHSQKFVMESNGISTAPFYSYEQSVHGKAVAQGSDKAAVCTDCHGSHDILMANNPKSTIFKFNVPNTCGKCHNDVKSVFMTSIHGQAISHGVSQAPVCTDCHGIHAIKAPIDPTSTVSVQNLARSTCARCHEGVRLSQDFGVPTGRVSTYFASYHGLASEMGSKTVANCASCHGVHNILPSTDPRSTIYPANLTKTCGKCHPGASQNFVKGKIHIDAPQAADIGTVAVTWTRRLYLLLIGATIGFMLLHNFVVWRKKASIMRKDPRRIVTRMEREQRIQHFLLLASFFTLVITGFALKFPNSTFARALLMGEAVRAILHRVAASVLVAVGLYHIYYVATRKSGRRMLVDMLPTPKDATDIVKNLRYYLGLGGKPARFGRFTYGEKMEYWALVWGTIVMATTGFMLWFRVLAGNLVPRWWLDVATTVHFYEAILATLAILVWHFYQVIFDPDIYPMNWAWWDGKMSAETYSHEHAEDRATIEAAVNEAAAEQSDEAVAQEKENDKAQEVAAGHHN